MKRIVLFLVATSLLMVSCVGSTSLWGQYQTPTPIGDDPLNPFPVVDVASTMTPTPTLEFTYTPPSTLTASPTSLININVTRQPLLTPTVYVSPTIPPNSILYYAQSGDWLPAVAKRFDVDVSEITSPKPISDKGLIDAGTLLIIPDKNDDPADYTPGVQLLPDSEVVYSATAVDFNVGEYVRQAGGYLATYRQYLGTTGWTSGIGAIERLSYENSIDPRLLLAILDYEAHWVRGNPETPLRADYPLDYQKLAYKGMFQQLVWALNQLSMGYYGWRAGTITTLTFRDGNTLRLDPTLNAGTVALMVYFSRQHTMNEWLRIMDATSGFPNFYLNMFGDPWLRAESTGPIFPPALTQPEMVLPFQPGKLWAYTGGPHGAWEHDGALAAIDFAPSSEKSGCGSSTFWTTAIASGLVVRSDRGIVVTDMDGDGSEQTGWNILYLHISSTERLVKKGDWVNAGDRIGHASCEGGVATGTHVHIARKYNGEWITADGAMPFVLSGWTVIAGSEPYLGKLVKGNKVITADIFGSAKSNIVREQDE
ncbi:MAG: M23 family metallopeptidase [Anaerolineales bacterium]